MTDTTLKIGDGDYPVMSGSVGPDVVDIRKLYAKTRHVHLRPGLHQHRELRSRR